MFYKHVSYDAGCTSTYVHTALHSIGRYTATVDTELYASGQ